jgi:exonuclease SbcC
MSIDSAYSKILLDNDYNMSIYREDRNPLDPKQLSGGERAILNIVFRCAIYRLLAVGFGSESNQGLPPIIFDEPTVFLDSNHIKQLIQLLDTMKIIGVGQVIVVSHDETLIDAADQVYRVQKDSSTNISQIYETSERNYKKAFVSYI